MTKKNNSAKVLVVGAGGMLGHAFLKSHPELCLSAGRRGGFDFTLDITDESECMGVVAHSGAQVVINCAAYTDVDGCESNREAAFAVNAYGAANLARATAACGNVRYVHISTDYVFDGHGDFPRLEEDECNPLNIYGQSKLEGEKLVHTAFAGQDENCLIVRVSALYGRGGKNFVDTIAGKVANGDALSVVDDQKTRPSFVDDIADEIMMIIENNPNVHGVMHMANEGSCSWFELACFIAGLNPSYGQKVSPCSSAQFVRPAKRPAFSVFDTAKHFGATGRMLRHWQDAVKAYLGAGGR